MNSGNVPTTASAYGTHDCDENFGGGPYPGSDIWVFVLPGNQGKVGDFVSVTAVFGANGTRTIPADGGAVVTGKGASKAWITTPAGVDAHGASAVITGTADKFNLTHTCPAAGGRTTSPTPAVTEPTPAASASTGSAGTDRRIRLRDRQLRGWLQTGDASGGTAGGDSGGLPVTGTAVTGLASARRGARGRRHRPAGPAPAAGRARLLRRGRVPRTGVAGVTRYRRAAPL